MVNLDLKACAERMVLLVLWVRTAGKALMVTMVFLDFQDFVETEGYLDFQEQTELKESVVVMETTVPMAGLELMDLMLYLDCQVMRESQDSQVCQVCLVREEEWETMVLMDCQVYLDKRERQLYL